MRRDSEALIEELARSAGPVRRIPAPGGVLAAVLSLAVAVATIVALQRNAPFTAFASAAYGGLTLGLVLLAVGSLAAGLGAAVPGRRRLEQGGLALLAGGIGLLLLGLAGSPASGDTGGIACLAWIGVVAAAALLPGFAFLRRAQPLRRRGRAAVGVCVGIAAAAASGVHATCAGIGAPHLLVNHLLGPLLCAVLLALSWSRPWERREPA